MKIFVTENKPTALYSNDAKFRARCDIFVATGETPDIAIVKLLKVIIPLEIVKLDN